MLTVYTLTFNESHIIKFMIDHYRTRFPDCRIVVFDNGSTDCTVDIARANNCEIRGYNSGNQLNDGIHAHLKNNCWKEAVTDWVCVIDCDELVSITQDELKTEQIKGSTRISTEGWTMVNLEDNLCLEEMNHGYRDPMYDKFAIFNRNEIKEISYDAGAHRAFSVGNVRDSEKKYYLHHYKYMNPAFEVAKQTRTFARMSEENKRRGWGINRLASPEEITSEFNGRRSSAVKVP